MATRYFQTLRHLALVAVIGFFLVSCTSEKGTIKINNNSPYKVSDVTVHYLNDGREDAIGNLQPKQSYLYTIKYTDAEDSIVISYVDPTGKVYSRGAVGYAAKYDKQRYTFKINESSD